MPDLLDVVLVAAIVVPIAITLLVGVLFTFSAHFRNTPLVFRCARCGRDFRRPAWKRFPAKCRACGARDWNGA